VARIGLALDEAFVLEGTHRVADRRQLEAEALGQLAAGQAFLEREGGEDLPLRG
jgi:hypothetical protein